MKTRKILAFILVIAMIAASAMFYSCEQKTDKNTLGKGKTTFKVDITDGNGTTTAFTIKTDEKTVGDALIHSDVKLIPADQAGYFTTLNGITAVWDDDTQNWWGFYIDGEMVAIGAFDAEIDVNASYAFKLESGMGDWDE